MSEGGGANEQVNSAAPTAPVAPDVENQRSRSGFVGARIGRWWNPDELKKKQSLILRGFALVFSLLSLIIMASNKHGPGKNFDDYEEYRYLLGIAILSSLYTGAQMWIQIREVMTGKKMFQGRTSAMVDFFGDQGIAYLLISSASAAVPWTNRMREGGDNIFTDSAATAISMSFFAFFSLGLSAAIVSGYKISSNSYI